MKKKSWYLCILLVVVSPAFGATRHVCRPVHLKGYQFQNSIAKQDQYFNKQSKLTLLVRCPVPTVLAEELITKYKLESSVRNTIGDAVYFEFNIRGRFKRIYIITRSPTLEFTFSARRKERANLDDTQDLIEAAYPKLN